MSQASVSRSDIIFKMDKIATSCGILSKEVYFVDQMAQEMVALYNYIYGLTCTPDEEALQTGMIQKAQVDRYAGCVHQVFEKKLATAFWELYDFLEAGKEDLLSQGEILFLVNALRFFKDVMCECMLKPETIQKT